MIALSAVQSFTRTLIQNAISFVETSTMLDTTMFIFQLGRHVTVTKLREGNAFTGVCHSVQRAGNRVYRGRVSRGQGIPWLGYPGVAYLRGIGYPSR